MKRISLLLAVLLLFGFVAQTFAAGTPAGTSITNQATGSYQDGGGNDMPGVSSNVVTTIVAQDPGLTINSPADQGVPNGGTVVYSHTITNNGNFQDTVSIGMTNTDNTKFTAVLYHDLGTVGVYDDGVDTVLTGDYYLAADASINVLTRVTNVSASSGNTTNSTVTASSVPYPAETASDEVVTTATEASISGSLDADQISYNPGETITYTVDFTNNGDETAYAADVTLHIPANTTYVPNSTYLDADGSGGGSAVQQNDGTVWSGGTGTVTVGDVTAGTNVTVTFQVTVNNDATGTISDAAEIDYDNASGAAYTQVELDEDVTVSRTYGVDASSPDPDKTGTGGNWVTYSIKVKNTGNGTDSYDVSASHDSSWTWEYYSDANGDGIINGADAELVGPNTGNIADGDSAYVIARVQIPGGTPDAAQDETTVTFTSTGDGSTNDSVVLTTDVDAPLLVLVKSVSPTGNQPPGTDLEYTVVVTNNGSADATTVVITDVIPANTTYKAGTLYIGAANPTDDPDADAAECDGTTATFNLGTIASGGGSETIKLTVTIN